MEAQAEPLIDPLGRPVEYLRLSVTDRCDLRCVYCRGEATAFVPRSEVLSLEELAAVAQAFVGLGVRKVRVTGGEPLVRRGVVGLMERLGAMSGLEELAMTTNGAQLAGYAQRLRQAGVQGLNISLDTLDPVRFRRLTRTDRLERVLAGIEAARSAGFPRIRLNCIAMRGRNDDEIEALVTYAVERGLDISFIEEMPFGGVEGHDRDAAYMATAEVQARVEAAYRLIETEPRPAAGPSRDYQVAGTATRVGFISPHSACFCDSCNRVRVTAEGRLLPCLSDEGATDLRAVLRAGAEAAPARLQAAIRQGLRSKPARHGLDVQALGRPQLVRSMSATGG